MENAKTRTMRRAVPILGSAKALAEALGVKRRLVESWLAGSVSPESAYFLAALDIVAQGPLGVGRCLRTK
jgi:DNA-binding transcriptional regulator YdaS (Cro superfamily)